MKVFVKLVRSGGTNKDDFQERLDNVLKELQLGHTEIVDIKLSSNGGQYLALIFYRREFV